MTRTNIIGVGFQFDKSFGNFKAQNKFGKGIKGKEKM